MAAKHTNNPTIQVEFQPIVSIPDYLTGEIRAKLAYVDEAIARAEVHPNRIVLQLSNKDRDLSLERQSEIIEKTQRVVSSMAKGAFKPKIQVLEDHLDQQVPFNEDPMPELISRREVSSEAAGIFSLGPLVTRLVDFFDRYFVALADSFEARPFRFPTLIPAEAMERVHYFRAFPHSLSFVTHLREDLDVIDRFSETAACEQGSLNTPPESFAGIKTLLSPAVCYHHYLALADKPLPEGKSIATAVGSCFRYEAINLASLERLWNFTMREVIFVGSKDFVLENREIARQRMAPFFEKVGLAYRVESANDPFFVGEFRKQAAFQSAFQLKFEIRLSLPYRHTTLAAGSYNYHQDFFGRNLNITLPDGSPAHTGCAAFGLERMAFAFLSQYGLDESGWPGFVRESIR
jgi:seryl-tRNA synthetase